MHPIHRHVRAELTSALQTLLPLAVLFTAGCYVRPAEGAFPCVTAADCPGGWVCRTDDLCWSTDDAACPTGQHFERSLAECREDLDAPVIHIAPATPRTLDELSVVIDTPTVETLRPGAGPITYRYEWSRDGAAVPTETTAGIDAELTTRDEVWRVEVTPTTDDGLEGPTAMAMVTIANTPPVLTTVGLSSYAPIVGETLQMSPGPTTDADGDSVSFDFEWLANGVPAAGATTAFLNTFAVDARLEGHARATDGMDAGEWIAVGPVTALADVTRWRALLPQREIGGEGWVIYDEPNDRFVIYAPTDRVATVAQVWEYPLNGRDEFVQLFPDGAPGRLGGSLVVLDERNRRVLMSTGARLTSGPDGAPTNDVFALEIEQRGRERWVQLHPTGDSPAPRLFAGGGYDSDQGRMILAGGADASGVLADVWALDTAVPGAERWERWPDLPFATAAGVTLDDRVRDRILLLVGDEVGSHTFELHDAAPATEVSAALEFGFGRTVAIEQDGEHALVIWGRRADETFLGIDRVELGSLAVTPYVASGLDPADRGGGSARVSSSGDVFVWPGPGSPDQRGLLDLFRLNVSAREWAAVHREGEDAPRGVEGASVVSSRTFWGGRASDGSTVGGRAWTFFDRWDVRELLGTAPAPRHSTGSCDADRGCILVGGINATGPVDDGAWRVDTSWESVGSLPEPAPATGAAYERSCGLVIGGIDASATATVRALVCDLTGCSWEVRASLPSALAWSAAATVDSGPTVLFGGVAGADVTETLQTLANCHSSSWSPVITTGPAPAARFGHTLTRGPVEAARQAFYLFGGGGMVSGSTSLDDAWRLVYEAGAWRWEPIVPAGTERPLGRRFHIGWYDAGEGRMLIFGGNANGSVVGDFWELRLRP